ncbi:histidine kinase [Flavobacterium paronense]|uniref:Sensor histidine kinase n=1 Tax=Flavobacterium paronense TaxID=1392775 RepID=A0ABV5GHH0_9FLAO|nr:histidine kinase [Flavobacterium paronense]MDN3676429.1 histidine kinase [Flavobacterium paronense]
MAQDPYSINYSINEGFPTSTTYSVTQDKNGFLWISTDVGIVKYDSHNFELFNTDRGLSDNEVFQMKTDFKGRNWLLTLNGKPSYIYKNKIYNEKNSELVKKIAGSNLIIDFYQDEKNTIYFVFKDGSIKIIQPNDTVKKVNTNKITTVGMWIWDKEFFILSSAGICNFSKNKMDSQIDKISTYRVYHDKTNTYFNEFNKLYKVTGSNQFKLIAAIPDKQEIINLYVENENKIWVCSRFGLYLFENNILKRKFFENYSISSLTKDFEGGYWLTTLTNGIIYVPSFDVFNDKINTEKPLKINCITINKKNEIWLGGDNNDYYIKKNGSIEKKTIFNQKRVDKINNIRFFNDKTYVVGKLGVIEIDGKGNEKKLRVGANDILIKKNDVFVGYTFIYKIKTKNLYNITSNLISSNNLISKRATVLCDGDNDNIWIGTNFGLYQYNPKDSITYFGERNEKLDTSIADLYYDTENHTLLVGSNSKGIVTIKKNLVQQKITKNSGLNSNTCNAIKKIASNTYLIGTNNGLNSLLIKNDNTFEIRNLNAVLGIKNNRIYDIDYLDNIVYLATGNGLLSFDYRNITSKKSKPKCLIINLKNQNNTKNNNFVFQYSKSDISIEYNGISYINQGNLTYYYKLNGKNDTWSTSTETKINYNSLPAGKYTFSVFCQDGSNTKSEVEIISFEILPPFWQKVWFILLMLLVVGFLIYSFIKYRLERQKKKFEIEKKNIQIERDKAQLEKQMVELEQKALRLQMNPHFIFNALNTIKGYYSEGDVINASSYISKFSKLLRMLLENTEQLIPLSKEIEMLEIYINLTKIRYKNKFEYELIVDESLNTNEISIPTLLLQPIVENAIIHGLAPKENKGTLVVRFLQKDNQLECSVEDNGIGRVASKMIQKNKEYQSKALEITKERLELLDTNIGKSTIDIVDLEVNSIPSGTKVIITIPLISIW